MLTVRGLRKRFTTDAGVVLAVDGVSFEIRQGEFYTLLGPSGCGKTTTLQCIAGLETPDDGEIVMGSELVYSGRQKLLVPAHRRDIGMVFQSYAIWPHMTVFENVAFPLVHGRTRLPKNRVHERVMKAINLVQLGGLEHRPSPLLSGGQQQRVAFARAIVHEPKLLLLDEPLSNLDAKLRDEMRIELRQLVRRLNMTTLYVTHDQVEALALSDRVAAMRDGRIVQEGTPREIYLTPRDQFVADFLGKSNFLEGRLVEKQTQSDQAVVETRLGPLRCRLTVQAAVGDSVMLAIRPEGIRLHHNGSGAGANRFEGRVETVVFGGDFLDCGVDAAGQVVRVRLDPFGDYRVGEQVVVEVPPERCITVAPL